MTNRDRDPNTASMGRGTAPLAHLPAGLRGLPVSLPTEKTIVLKGGGYE